MPYDHDGNQVSPGDVLDDEELAAYAASRRASRGSHSFAPPRTHVFPVVDRETGLDVEGCEWGARTYGSAS